MLIRTKHCATCPATIQYALANGWLVLEQPRKYADWVWECPDCTDKRIGPTMTIATYTLSAKELRGWLK